MDDKIREALNKLKIKKYEVLTNANKENAYIITIYGDLDLMRFGRLSKELANLGFTNPNMYGSDGTITIEVELP